MIEDLQLLKLCSSQRWYRHKNYKVESVHADVKRFEGFKLVTLNLKINKRNCIYCFPVTENQIAFDNSDFLEAFGLDIQAHDSLKLIQSSTNPVLMDGDSVIKFFPFHFETHRELEYLRVLKKGQYKYSPQIQEIKNFKGSTLLAVRLNRIGDSSSLWDQLSKKTVSQEELIRLLESLCEKLPELHGSLNAGTQPGENQEHFFEHLQHALEKLGFEMDFKDVPAFKNSRIHGDLHFGQILISQQNPKAYYFIDFEGEPEHDFPLPNSPQHILYDLACLFRSAEYLVRFWGENWGFQLQEERCLRGFLENECVNFNSEADLKKVYYSFKLYRTLYEYYYESNNRPENAEFVKTQLENAIEYFNFYIN